MTCTRLASFIPAVLLFTALGGLPQRADARSWASGGLPPAPAALMLQGGTFQQSAPAAAAQNERERLCMSRRGDWERNRTPWSLFLGFIIFLTTLYLLTYLRFKNTVVRVIVSLVAAALVGPAIMAVIVQDLLRVCLSPPGFLGSLSAPMLWWTLGGSLGTLAVIGVLRYFVIRRKFRQELPAA